MENDFNRIDRLEKTVLVSTELSAYNNLFIDQFQATWLGGQRMGKLGKV